MTGMNGVRAAVWAMLLATMPVAALAGYSFTGIEGGRIDLEAFRGQPVLVVNTASLCGFAGQFDDLQALQDRYGPRGLVVLAVPSDDFNQELATGAKVKEYCEARFDITLPMTEITRVTGPDAHPFYVWLAREHGFTPKWNFNKVLIGPSGDVVATWGSTPAPTSQAILSRLEPLLN
jgi:glutathione peroxidase